MNNAVLAGSASAPMLTTDPPPPPGLNDWFMSSVPSPTSPAEGPSSGAGRLLPTLSARSGVSEPQLARKASSFALHVEPPAISRRSSSHEIRRSSSLALAPDNGSRHGEGGTGFYRFHRDRASSSVLAAEAAKLAARLAVVEAASCIDFDVAPEMTLSGVGRTATFHLVEVPPTPDGSRGGAPEEDPLAALPRRGARGSMDMGANLQRKLHKGRSKIFDALKIGR